MNEKNASMKEQIKCRMAKSNFYDVLDLNSQCSADDIKRSYKRLAFRFHPDKNTTEGAKDVFTKITNAYNKLSNPVSKAQYDEKTTANKKNNASNFNFNSYRQSTYYPFGNQSRFSGFNFTQHQEKQEKKRKQQEQTDDMQRQFEKVFRKFFNHPRPNQRRYQQKPNYQHQKNEQRQYTERMKKKYQQQRRAQQKKEKAQKEKQKKKNLATFFLVLFVVVLFGPYLFSFLNTKPLYSLSKNTFYNSERKTQKLEFSYFINDQQLSKHFLEYKSTKIEQIVDKRILENLKNQCINAKIQKKNLEGRAYKEKIGKARNFFFEEANRIQMQPCNKLFSLTLQHIDYLKSLIK